MEVGKFLHNEWFYTPGNAAARVCSGVPPHPGFPIQYPD